MRKAPEPCVLTALQRPWPHLQWPGFPFFPCSCLRTPWHGARTPCNACMDMWQCSHAKKEGTWVQTGCNCSSHWSLRAHGQQSTDRACGATSRLRAQCVPSCAHGVLRCTIGSGLRFAHTVVRCRRRVAKAWPGRTGTRPCLWHTSCARNAPFAGRWPGSYRGAGWGARRAGLGANFRGVRVHANARGKVPRCPQARVSVPAASQFVRLL